MVRQFKYHEQKLLKKVDFLNVRHRFYLSHLDLDSLHQWKQDANLREIKVMRRYHIQDREDYHKCVPNVRSQLFCLTYFSQVQQAVRFSTVLCAPNIATSRSRPISITHGGPT